MKIKLIIYSIGLYRIEWNYYLIILSIVYVVYDWIEYLGILFTLSVVVGLVVLLWFFCVLMIDFYLLFYKQSCISFSYTI